MKFVFEATDINPGLIVRSVRNGTNMIVEAHASSMTHDDHRRFAILELRTGLIRCGWTDKESLASFITHDGARPLAAEEIFAQEDES